MTSQVLIWRRLDVPGLERLELETHDGEVTATGTTMLGVGGSLRVIHRWELDGDWRAQCVLVERWNKTGYQNVRLERSGGGWRVDGSRRPELDGADEPDLSVTPFCNTLPIRRISASVGSSLTLDTAYIDAETLAVSRSRQRYERRGPGHFRYFDLGFARGFESDLLVDDQGLVLRYENLFERIAPSARFHMK
jgi:hypothetical protein